AVWQVDPPKPAKLLREIMYCAHFIHSHTAHFYALAAPDFVLGPDADPSERNILGVVGKVGLEAGGEVIRHRAMAQDIQALICGSATQPVTGLPGGQSKGITEAQRLDIVEKGKSLINFAQFTLQLFEDVVLKNKAYVDLILGDVYRLDTYSMGLVDENNQMNIYDGKIRVMDPTGKEYAKFKASEYRDFIDEHVEEWTYLKFPFLKKVGWKGFVDGIDSGIYTVAPLGRMNVTEGMATPLANSAYEKMISVLGGKPLKATLATHWARLVELLYAAERMVDLASDPEASSTNIRTIPTAIPTEGVGVVEAPRGTLFHFYRTDEKGLITKANLVVGTTNNHASINLSIKQAAKMLIKNGKVDQGLLNMVEMAFRAYDPCFSCATHSMPGKSPMEIKIFDHKGNLCERLWQ
ncbi:MAG: Ni/Fe hydrogenase subunit alpha, partial [Peptococcaceae bacterium]|nr:Ni/Fe hydrogenase subunit alpha [Peptococcaceae bacterium]